MAQIYLVGKQSDMGFHLARIPKDFVMKPREMFDPGYMRALFELGKRTAQEGEAWVAEEH